MYFRIAFVYPFFNVSTDLLTTTVDKFGLSLSTDQPPVSRCWSFCLNLVLPESNQPSFSGFLYDHHYDDPGDKDQVFTRCTQPWKAPSSIIRVCRRTLNIIEDI